MNFEDISLVVYSDMLGEMGTFKRTDKGEIEVVTPDENYKYEDIKSYWEHHWEFIGTV